MPNGALRSLKSRPPNDIIPGVKGARLAMISSRLKFNIEIAISSAQVSSRKTKAGAGRYFILPYIE
jgi:hypothetical protein